jgi:hypothetical protein
MKVIEEREKEKKKEKERRGRKKNVLEKVTC